MRQQLRIMQFKSSGSYRSWLKENHKKSSGIWIKIFKKDSNEISISYAEALDQSLCFGWIDGQKQKYDDHSWLQKFTPRRSKSSWSKVNVQHAERLIKSGEMTPAGLAVIEAAKSDGRWTKAYDSPGSAKVPDDFLKALENNKKAKTFFETLDKRNVYSIVYRLQTAKKPETREKRMKLILEMLKKGRKFHA